MVGVGAYARGMAKSKVTINPAAVEKLRRDIEAAVDEACNATARRVPTGDVAEVRAVLTEETRSRFKAGTGPDEALLDQLAQAIVSRRDAVSPS